MNKESGKYGINRKLGVGENRIKILFVCHGNICRSPMAEFMFRDMVARQGLGDCFYIESAATSMEECGNPVYPPARRKLAEHGISAEGKRARTMTRQDYDKFDYLLGMEEWNIRNILRIVGKDPEHKVHRLLDYSAKPRDIADPWYTGDFDTTWNDISEGLNGFLETLRKEGRIERKPSKEV